MDIKNLRPGSTRYKSGDFAKYKPKKYFGKTPIWYRSGWEFKIMIKMELNENVEKWSSEQIKIPYVMKERINNKIIISQHTYNTDFTVILKDGRKFILEVKPKSQAPLNENHILRDPVKRKNYFKWKAALDFAKLNGYIFKVVTEDQLKTKIF